MAHASSLFLREWEIWINYYRLLSAHSQFSTWACSPHTLWLLFRASPAIRQSGYLKQQCLDVMKEQQIVSYFICYFNSRDEKRRFWQNNLVYVPESEWRSTICCSISGSKMSWGVSASAGVRLLRNSRMQDQFDLGTGACVAVAAGLPPETAFLRHKRSAICTTQNFFFTQTYYHEPWL